MECRFEDRLAGRALRLAGDPIRIEARSADAVAPALREIERARAGGRWIALLLDYELGEWLLPEALRAPASGAAPAPRE
ncbi:aminodeoxychorismate synthase component 1, partial [Bordetella bronchiseptica]